MEDHALVLYRAASGARKRRRACALLALLPCMAAAQDDSAVLRWQQDDTAGIAEFRIYYGRTPESLTGMKLVLDPRARTATVDGLADGRWYFAVVAVGANAAESEPSGLICLVIPSGSCDSPLDEQEEQKEPKEESRPARNVTAAAVTTPNIRVSISNIDPANWEFDVSIEGNGSVMIELADELLFDWCSPRGLSGLPAITPTTPSLGDRNNDGNRRPAVTFTAPVERTRCDGDGADGDSPAFGGATVTVQGVSKRLVESSGAWSAQFP